MRVRRRWSQIAMFGVATLAVSTTLAIEVIDDRGRLDRLGRDMGYPNWSSIQCGERETFFRSQTRCESKCSANVCVDQCTEATPENNSFDLQIEDCTADQVAIYGTNNFEGYIQRSDFESHGTWIVAFLQNIEHFTRPVDSIEINSVMPRMVKVIENGKLRQVFGTSVLMDLRTQKTSMGRMYEMVFIPSPTLLGGLVYFGSVHNDFFLKKKGVASVR